MTFKLIFLDEMTKMQDSGFGKVVSITEGRHRPTFFLKPWPGSLQRNNRHLKQAGCSLDQYTVNFNDVSSMTERLEDIVRNHHPHVEAMGHLLTQESEDSNDDDGMSE